MVSEGFIKNSAARDVLTDIKVAKPHGAASYFIPADSSRISEGAAEEIGAHRWMLANSSQLPSENQPELLMYCRIIPEHFGNTLSSSIGNWLGAKLQYDAAEEKLLSLSLSAAEDQSFDTRSIDSARIVLAALRTSSYLAPEVSWHGGDAVVMLWAVGNTTYAITVTDGEFGYVVRRNRKAIKLVDSIEIDKFNVAQLGYDAG